MTAYKRKISTQRGGKENGRGKINFDSRLIVCSHCGKILPHQVCPYCGYYKNTLVLKIKENPKRPHEKRSDPDTKKDKQTVKELCPILSEPKNFKTREILRLTPEIDKLIEKRRRSFPGELLKSIWLFCGWLFFELRKQPLAVLLTKRSSWQKNLRRSPKFVNGALGAVLKKAIPEIRIQRNNDK